MRGPVHVRQAEFGHVLPDRGGWCREVQGEEGRRALHRAEGWDRVRRELHELLRCVQRVGVCDDHDHHDDDVDHAGDVYLLLPRSHPWRRVPAPYLRRILLGTLGRLRLRIPLCHG